MGDKTHFIGINQKIPFQLMDKHLYNFIQKGTVDRSALKEDMALLYKGKNRADKGAQFAWRVLTHDTVSLDYIRKAMGNDKYANLKSTDRAALILSLLSNAYPIFYDTIVILSKVYRVQDLVSRSYVAQKIGDLYGSNRTLDIALDAIFPMLANLGVIIKLKKGVYQAVAGVELVDERVAELFVASGIRLSGGKHISLDDFDYRDWHFFFKPPMPPYKGQSIISVTSTGGRQGYVSFSARS